MTNGWFYLITDEGVYETNGSYKNRISKGRGSITKESSNVLLYGSNRNNSNNYGFRVVRSSSN